MQWGFLLCCMFYDLPIWVLQNHLPSQLTYPFSWFLWKGWVTAIGGFKVFFFHICSKCWQFLSILRATRVLKGNLRFPVDYIFPFLSQFQPALPSRLRLLWAVWEGTATFYQRGHRGVWHDLILATNLCNFFTAWLRMPTRHLHQIAATLSGGGDVRGPPLFLPSFIFFPKQVARPVMHLVPTDLPLLQF